MTSQAYDKVLLHKAKVIERCVARAREEHIATQGHFSTDHTRQDAAVLNLQRSCEAALDMAQRVISQKGWGVAETSKDLFVVLQRQQVMEAALAKTLINMVGFRTLAVHDYEELNSRHRRVHYLQGLHLFVVILGADGQAIFQCKKLVSHPVKTDFESSSHALCLHPR